MILLLALVLPSSGWTNSQNAIQITPVKPGTVQTLPRQYISLALRVANSDVLTHSFKGHLQVPEGWSTLTPEVPFILEGDERTIRIINLYIPLQTQAGLYTIAYTVTDDIDPQLRAEYTFDVEVLLLADIRIQKRSEPEMVIAGSLYKTEYALFNASNAPCTVLLSVTNEPDYPLLLSEKMFRLAAGESRNFQIEVKTDKSIRTKTDYYHRIEAKAESLGEMGAEARVLSSTNIIPLISGTTPGYRTLPVELKLIGISDNQFGNRSQFGLYGSGALNARGTNRVEFLLQGPGYNNLLTFGQIREEYRVSISSEKGSIHFGDRIFTLSKLTNFGHYGRGLEGRLNINRFSLKWYTEKIHFLPIRTSQEGLQLTYRAGENRAELNFSHTRRQPSNDDQVLSLVFKLAPLKKFFVLGEIAQGQNSRSKNTSGRSLWLETQGHFPLLNFRAHLLFSDYKFPGTYRDLSFQSANIWLFPQRKISFTGSFYNQLKNANLKFSGLSTSTKSLQTGIQFSLEKNHILSFLWHQHNKKDLMPETLFNYRDHTIRIGLSSNFNFLNLQASYDRGKTDNLLTGESRRLREYIASMTLKPLDFISIGGQFRFRDQNKNFTGDTTNYSSINLNVQMSFRNTLLSALYQTSSFLEFFDEILNDELLASQLIKNHMFMTQVSLRQKLPNKHTIGLHYRKISSPLYNDQKDNRVVFIEYSIPVGIPLQRLTSGCALTGRIYERDDLGKNLSGIIVRANGLTAVTDGLGRFKFLNMPPGKYYLNLDFGSIRKGYLPVQKTPMEILATSSGKLERNIVLVPGCSISGRVTQFRQQDSGQLKNRIPSEADSKKSYIPLTGLANIHVELVGESETRSLVTNNLGEFIFHDLRPGKWKVRIHTLNLPEFHILEEDVFDIMIESGEKRTIEARVLPRIRSIKFLDAGTVKIKKKISD
ncbi:MAG: carboxypeptidase-like regulatory domain-containing protein [Candidatus Aminicenantes bacterium]|nr:carboxypeptidase-like regulatory domain-containing protein [Candidatus Aminicenantes bacterium]